MVNWLIRRPKFYSDVRHRRQVSIYGLVESYYLYQCARNQTFTWRFQCFLTQTFPFFASDDDTEALLELINIFGTEDMSICAARHSKVYSPQRMNHRSWLVCILDVQIPRLAVKRHSWYHLVRSLLPGKMQIGHYPVNTAEDFHICRAAFDFLDRALDLDPFTRFTAGELLEHPFLNISENSKLQHL